MTENGLRSSWYSTGDSAWCSVMTERVEIGGEGGRLKRELMYVYIQLIYDVVQKLMQHCRAIILQLKK